MFDLTGLTTCYRVRPHLFFLQRSTRKRKNHHNSKHFLPFSGCRVREPFSFESLTVGQRERVCVLQVINTSVHVAQNTCSQTSPRSVAVKLVTRTGETKGLNPSLGKVLFLRNRVQWGIACWLNFSSSDFCCDPGLGSLLNRILDYSRTNTA